MRKLFPVIALLLMLGIVFALFVCVVAFGTPDTSAGVNLGQGWYYPMTTKIVETDRENDVVVCEDFNGNLWEFEGCEDWQVGDVASLLMNSKGTASIFDDEIVTARYNGTFEGWH